MKTALLFSSICVLGWSEITLADKQIEHANVAFDVSPRGNQIVFSSADGDLFLLNLRSLLVSRLTRTKNVESSPAFSPDGRFIVYSAEEGTTSHIFIRSLDGKTEKPLTRGKATTDATPRFSPDGKSVVFARAFRYRPYSMGGWTWDNWDVCTVKSDGTRQRRLTRKTYYGVNNPAFLAGGKTVVYSAMGGYNDEVTKLFAVNAQGGGLPRILTPDKRKKVEVSDSGTLASSPSVSHDGRRLVFISDRAQPYAYDLFTMNADGTETTPLHAIATSTYNQNPIFSPDGKTVYYLAGTEFNASSRPIFSLWSIGIHEKKPRCIVGSALFTDPTTWKPSTSRPKP